MKTILLLLLITCSFKIFAGVCSERKEKIEKELSTQDYNKNKKEIYKKYPKLLVLGEPHGTHYLEKLPKIIPFLSKGIKCAFIEQPFEITDDEIDQLITGNKTKHFQTDTSFEYVPLLKYLRANNVKIYPVDNRFNHPEKISPLDWMKARDDEMYIRIMKDVNQCEKSLFIVGKHHITPDISGYNKTLGHRLKESLKSQVIFVDLIARKNYFEEYCSYSENNLFDNKNSLIHTRDLADLRYSTFVSHSFWTDFDYILHLKREIEDSIFFEK